MQAFLTLQGTLLNINKDHTSSFFKTIKKRTNKHFKTFDKRHDKQ